MDTIVLQGMQFYGYHGCFAEEQEGGQPFRVDLTMYVDLTKAGESDDLTDTVNYSAVYEDVRRIVETGADPVSDTKPYNLIEKVAAVIAHTVLTDFPAVSAVSVTVHKPHAPIRGLFDDVAVTIERKRHG